MPTDTYVEAIVDVVRSGANRRIVGCGGMGKTRLLDALADRLGPEAVTRWNAGLDPAWRPDDDGVLLVDDAHLADEERLALLARRPGGVVVAHRPTRRETAELLDTLDGSPVVLDRLRCDAVRDLIELCWGTAPDDAVAEQVTRATGGVPRLVIALVGREPGGRPGRTAALDELVRSERERLRPGARALLDVAAVLPGLDLSLLAAAVELDLADATAAAALLAATGLALDGSARLAPVVADLVRFVVPASRIALISERAAAAADDHGADPRVVAARLHAAGVTGPRTAAYLLSAARRTFEEDPDRAAQWIVAAGRVGAATPDLLALRAITAFRRDRAEETIAAADELLRGGTSGDPTLRRAAIEAAAVVLARRGAWERAAQLAEWVGAAGDSAIALVALARLVVGDAAGVRAAVAEVETDGRGGLRPASAAAIGRALLATLDDDPAPALPRLLEAARLHELSGPTVPLPESPHVLTAIVACHLWEFEIAAQVLADAPGGAAPRHHLVAAWASFRRGDVAAAAATVARVGDGGPLAARDELLGLAITAGIARNGNDLDGMQEAWRRARMLLLRTSPDLLMLQPLGELLVVGARLGERATVQSLLSTMRALVARAGRPPLWALSQLWDELQVAIALNDPVAAQAAASAAAALPSGVGRADAVVAAASCWAGVLASHVDVAAVRGAARGLAGVGLSREAARLAGAAAVRERDSVERRELLQLARELDDDRPHAVPTADALSPRERDVAQHLIAGLTYREIGSQLFLAPKTIEHHVARIRRKLGATSRAELLAALRHHVSVPTS